MKAVIYLRVSSTDQISGTSLETQERSCREYCKREHLPVFDTIHNDGVSAQSNNVKRILELVDYCKANRGKFDILVVYRTDRFARDTYQHLYLREELRKLDIVLRSATEDLGEDKEKEFFETVRAAVNQLDNSIRRERAINGMKYRLTEGNWPWFPVVGYLRKKETGVRLSFCLPDSNVAPYIEETFKLYSTGNYSYQRLANRLNHYHLVNYQGTKLHFTNQTVNNMLSNKFYIGIVQSSLDGGIEHEGKHQPIISRSLWIQCQTSNRRLGKVRIQQKFNPDFPLRGLLRCPCGKPMMGAISKGRSGKGYGYYFCRYRDSGNWRNDDVHQQFLELLDEIQPSEEDLNAFFEVYTERVMSAYQRSQATKKRYLFELDDIGREKAALLKLRLKEEITAEEFKVQKAGYDEQLNNIHSSMAELEKKDVPWHEVLAYGKSYLTGIRERWESLPIEQKYVYGGSMFPSGLSLKNGKLSNQNLLEVFTQIKHVTGLKSGKCEPDGFNIEHTAPYYIEPQPLLYIYEYSRVLPMVNL